MTQIFLNLKSFEEIKDQLLQIYNIWYDQNKTFNELFDGFICKDKTFEKMIYDYETSPVFSTPHKAVMQMMATYQTYIDTLTQFMAIEAFQEIMNTLVDEISDHGYPSIFYGKTYNEKLVKLTNEDMEKYFQKSTQIKHKIEEITNIKNKEIVELCKQRRKKKYKDNQEELNSKIEKLKYELFSLITTTQNCECLMLVLRELDRRFISANTNYESSKTGDIIENVLDYISGATPSNTKNGFMVKSFYATKLELNCIERLFDLLKDYTPEQSKSTEKQAQPNA